MRITVKSWWYEREQLKAQRYNFTLHWEKVTEILYKGRTIKDIVEDMTESEKEKFFLEFIEADKADITEKEIGFYLWGNKIKETEKAVQFELAYWNLNRAGRYVTDAPTEVKWKTWIPKSVLIA